jgi:hypothetical protein
MSSGISRAQLNYKILFVFLNLQCGVLFFTGLSMPTMLKINSDFTSHLLIAPVWFWVIFYSGFGLFGYISLFIARVYHKPRLWIEWSIASGVVFFILASINYRGGGRFLSTDVMTNVLFAVNCWLQSIGLAEYGVIVRIIKNESK